MEDEINFTELAEARRALEEILAEQAAAEIKALPESKPPLKLRVTRAGALVVGNVIIHTQTLFLGK